MKRLILLVILTSSLFSWSQNIYGSISGGYLLNSKNDQPESYIVNTFHQISLPWFWRNEKFTFKNSFHADLSFGHMVTENIGYEVSGGYLKPMSVSDNSIYGVRVMNGDFYQASAKFVLSIPMEKFDLYTKLGLNVANGRMNYLQTLRIDDPTSGGPADFLLEYEYKGPLSLGFNGTLGISIPISKKFSFFTEVTFVAQSYSPKSGKMIALSENGIDLLANDNFEPYYSQIEFGDVSEWIYWSTEDKSQPQKLYKRSYSLGGYGLTVGFKFILWRKKNNEYELI